MNATDNNTTTRATTSLNDLTKYAPGDEVTYRYITMGTHKPYGDPVTRVVTKVEATDGKYGWLYLGEGKQRKRWLVCGSEYSGHMDMNTAHRFARIVGRRHRADRFDVYREPRIKMGARPATENEQAAMSRVRMAIVRDLSAAQLKQAIVSAHVRMGTSADTATDRRHLVTALREAADEIEGKKWVGKKRANGRVDWVAIPDPNYNYPIAD